MKDIVLEYLETHGTITTKEAFEKLGCTRLSEYIRQIRLEQPVYDEWIHSTNRFGQKVKYKKYWLGRLGK
ncbi:MAG: hypothetical protein E7171_00305 [Firmicutes bacterium]|nr:hypothetical protein [Bacillota bacterium]